MEIGDVSNDEPHQFGADVRANMDALEIGGATRAREFCRTSPSQCRPGQRAVGIENRHPQSPVVAGATAALSQKSGNLGIFFSEAPDRLTPKARVLVERVERDAIDQS